MENSEHKSYIIIAAAADAQSAMTEALAAARRGDFADCRQLMKDAEKLLLSARRAQTALIKSEANGEKLEYSVIRTHAQDLLMNALNSKNLIDEMIHLHEEIKSNQS